MASEPPSRSPSVNVNATRITGGTVAAGILPGTSAQLPLTARIRWCWSGVHVSPRDIEVLAFATQGPGSRDEERLRALLDPVDATFLRFDTRHKALSAVRLLREI